MKKYAILLLCLLAAGSGHASETELVRSSGLNTLSYAAGFRLGDTFKKQRIPLVPEMVLLGLEDARNSIRPVMPKGEMRMILNDPKKFLIEDVKNRSDLAKKAGSAFLQANAREGGVNVLESGLQYKILTAGAGKKPTKVASIRLNYQGVTVNGQVFDTTYNSTEPAVMSVNAFIPGLSEGLQLMSEGGEWEFYLPAHLAYGSNGPLADQALIFRVELIEVVSNGQ